MNRSKYSNTPYKKFEIHQVNSAGKIRDSPTSSILKTPTPIFVTTRSSSAKTKRLKFANGPVDLLTLRNGTHESNELSPIEDNRLNNNNNNNNNGEINFGDTVVEVAISPVKTMQVSPESWKAFLEYSKYNDYSNETEKTDYTYSRLSKYRHKEIIPGFLIRPNLSRSSISSTRSSYSLPGTLSSFNESYQTKGYDFNVYNKSDSEVINDTKTFSQPNKFLRSKYYLRSSNLNWNDTGETDSSTHNYVEKENLVYSPSEKFIKTYSYPVSNPLVTTSHYHGAIRSMDYDDVDIDEVDIDPAYTKKQNYAFSVSNVDRSGIHGVQSPKMSDSFKNLFTTVFLYIASVGTLMKDLFSKYALRRNDKWSQSPSGLYNWKNENLGAYGKSESWMPWKEKAAYSTGAYYSGGYYDQPRSWHQRMYYYFYDRFFKLRNLVWGSSSGRTSYRYHETIRRKRFWWFIIPLLFLAGSFLGYIDFFSNPKTILNTVYNWSLFIPSFLHYTVMVFIPWLIFEGIPFFILKALPNFITIILPYFIMNTVPFYFWVVVRFFSSISLTSIWNILVGISSFFLNILMTTGMYLFSITYNLISGVWLFKAEQENGFLSNQYKELDCRTNGFFTSLENTFKPVWRSSYIAYKKAAASVSCYIDDSWERLKLPFIHIQEQWSSKFSSLFEGILSFFYTAWNKLFQVFLKSFYLVRDSFSNLYSFLLDFLGDFLNAVYNMIYYISKYFADVFFTFCNNLRGIFVTALSYLYLLIPVHKSGIKNEHLKPDLSKEICLKQQNSIDKLTSELKDFKSITYDLTSLKKKIDDLEAEFKKEREFRANQNNFLDRQLDESHKILQKYQTTVNHALLSSKRSVQPASLQYLLHNQSEALKQWISKNFLLKSDSTVIDENKVSLLIANYGNKTSEEVLALKRELRTFVNNHRNDLKSMQNYFSNFEANNLAGGDVSLVYVKKLISDAIKLYDADKTGRVDYALETAGGQVQSIRCTETYMERPKSYVLMGWSVYTEASSPREAIRPGVAAGQCWAFVGSQGYLVLKLSHTITVTGFTMEHISKLLVPKGHIESAPKNFSMWGLKHEHDLEPYLFGEYTYLDNGETIQYFPVTYPTNERYSMVELKITSNHGNPNYTCLYRIRVHGDSQPIHL